MKKILRKIGYGIENLLERLTRFPQAVRLGILICTVLLVIALLVLIIVGIANCSGCKGSDTLPVTSNVEPTSSFTPSPNQDDNQTPTDMPVITNEAGQVISSDEPTYTDEPSETPFPVMKKHDKSDEVTLLQMRLMELGYLDLDETTNYFGSGTEYAVKLFQRQHTLTEDGVVGSQTYTLLYSFDAEPYVLKEGAEGKDVKMVQDRLEELGYLSSSQVDGIYGQNTISAVTAFQKRNSLSQDGLAGEKTLEKIYSDDAKISSALEKKQKEEAAKKDDKDDDKPSTSETTTTRLDRFIKAAKSKLGCEYVLGDKGPNTFDCSGFVYWCLRQAGVSCSRLNASGFSNKTSWKKISSYGDVQKGDILFFKSDTSDRVSHCGIYIGSGMMIDASSANGEVVKRSVSSYWKRNFVCARRPW